MHAIVKSNHTMSTTKENNNNSISLSNNQSIEVGYVVTQPKVMS